MGAKASLLAFARETPRAALRPGLVADEADARLMVDEILAPGVLEPAGSLMLDEAVWPEHGMVCAGRFADVDVLTSRNLGRDRPSELAEYVARSVRPRAYAVAMDSAVGWLGFAVWENGTLVRSLSLSPDEGAIEQIGEPLPLEQGFWAGQHAVELAPDCSLPFHPLDLGAEVLRVFFGFVLEGSEDAGCFDPEDIPLAGFRSAGQETRLAELNAAAMRMVRAE
ncbi:DUF6928 family protein [Streptomyces sp. NPDC018019]|uniref:DUF6928 family protein n=1 Tax=Streptomyces sp. NPDC018019 TaxID=3365030 RepID=UPI0037A23393